MSLVKTSKNPEFALTAEKYASMLKFYLDTPTCTINSLMRGCNVGRIMAKRAMTLGWPELNLPPIPAARHQLVDPISVHEEMAAIRDVRKDIHDNLFGHLNFEGKIAPTSAIREATVRAAEKGVASRVGASLAVKMGRVVDEMASKFLSMIESGDVEMPEKLRIEHIVALAKASQSVTKAIFDSAQTEQLLTGVPDDVAGIKITNLLIGANLDELREVVETGNLPKRLLGIPEAISSDRPVITVEPIEINDGRRTEETEQSEADRNLEEEEGT
jgi:hypothetical protein